MNALYNHATKQKQLLNKDLSTFENDLLSAPISLQGSITTTLLALNKTISKYKEQLKSYQQAAQNNNNNNNEELLKYESRLHSLSKDYSEYNKKFHDLKQKYDQETKNAFNNTNSSSSSNPFDDTTVQNIKNRRTIGDYPYNNDAAATTTTANNTTISMKDGLLKEQGVFQRSTQQLDYILETGQQSLENIIEQNRVLEKLQNTMTNSLTTLGVSQRTINKINKRVFKDKLIFWFALILMFLGFYFILKLF
ncbi:related to Protein transport protein BOS1 [Saccharomycodes ludwigii]|uniref:Protein transport protein BOS1 n=1 Tax=Saccharomycodes ludwigii TaxID=36035 RepID=A0A376B9Q7_9ASCO|nr:hypothetical protein SCDLUD_000862 [Saccharomycodes ludwigii]KAH3903241.1 hypothetical protein SCDLUD_000862 [Saccharomycodes ludwigii]SSD61415.1 related to Protein transport protein BOS1 [Saccharomycodes ludwigii]